MFLLLFGYVYILFLLAYSLLIGFHFGGQGFGCSLGFFLIFVLFVCLICFIFIIYLAYFFFMGGGAFVSVFTFFPFSPTMPCS